MESIRFTVPLTPPSVNHYKGTNRGRYFVTREATAFKDAMALLAAGRTLDAKHYAVQMAIFLGKGGKGDIDNFPKCVLDGLKGTVIRSDAQIRRLIIDLDRDWANPRTEIEVSPL